MSNLETHPGEIRACSNDEPVAAAAVEVMPPRVVPLGGPRAMTVRRTLPSKGRTMIGAWCFLDHYGTDRVSATGGMRVPPHPHTGLQTVSWLFEGEVEHRDSVGSHAIVRPGELNLMTAGRGISHSEVSTPSTDVLHGAQLWVALPDAVRHMPPAFESRMASRTTLDDASVMVFMGSLNGVSTDATVFSPLVAAQLDLPAGGVATLPLEPGFEHGVLVDSKEAGIQGTTVQRGELAYLATGCPSLSITADDTPVRLLLIGGEPLGERLLMWWNFVGRTHEEVVGYRAAWQASAIGVGGPPPPGTKHLFEAPVAGATAEYEGAPLPAPELPTVRLKPRD